MDVRALWWVAALGLLPLGAGCEPDTAWRPAFDASETGWVMNVSGLRDDAQLAVGGSFERGRVVVHDGATWSEPAIPEVPLLNWVHGFAPDTFFAVGASGTILRADGGAWSVMESPTDQDLWGVWGARPDDVWAVGGSARLPSVAAPTILRFDGTRWSVVPLPPLERANVDALFKVWGSGPDDVYAVGDKGVVLRWDGAAWTELFVGATDDLVAVWGTGPDDVVAVGGRSNGVLARWDGVSWRSELLAPLPGLNGVWMRRPGVAHVVGLRGTLVTVDVETFEVTEEPVAEALDFHAVHGVDGRMVAVGGNLAVPSNATGIAWTRELRDDE